MWPEVVEPHVSSVGVAFRRLSGVAADTPEDVAWRRSYTRHIYCSIPALMTTLRAVGVPSDAAERVHRVGWHHLCDRGAGVIAVSRTGYSFVVPWLLARSGREVAVVAEPAPLGSDLLQLSDASGIARGSLSQIPAGPLALIGARNALKAGRYAAIYPELRRTGGRQVEVPFLKGRLAVPLGAATLAWMTRAPLIPARSYSEGGLHIVAEFGEALEPSHFDNPVALNRALFHTLSAWVDEHPEQWVGWEYLAQDDG